MNTENKTDISDEMVLQFMQLFNISEKKLVKVCDDDRYKTESGFIELGMVGDVARILADALDQIEKIYE